MCIASNDIPPAVSKRIVVYVHCKYFILMIYFFIAIKMG